MGKIGTFLALMILATLAAGVFGMLHNQLSYSVGPDYFHKFKFAQFNIPETTTPRLGAAQVGWSASWWTGPILALPVMLYGLMRAPSTTALWAGGIAAIGTVIFMATLAAMAGLTLGIAALSLDLPLPFTVPEGLNPEHFTRAGAMHDATYLGGAIGALLAFWPMTRATRA